ncbi:hypothetical protein ACFYTQ_12360 [Nocardia sp. NPDC004068]|uniref:hypothetical protein n=1 Tax=Nocardia sp. NPDC004068 TaxID=3364303 RepID=UPI00367B8218
MSKEIGGKTFRKNPNPPSEEHVARMLASAAEWQRKKDAVPPEERFHLSDKFGGWDFDGTEFAGEVNEKQRQRRDREQGDNANEE